MEDLQPQQEKLALAKRPDFSANHKNMGRPTNLVTNMYPVRYTGKDLIYIYSIDIVPEIAQDSRSLREKIIKGISGELKNDFNEKDDKRIVQGFNMFSFYSRGSKDKPLVYQCMVQGEEYTVYIRQVKASSFKDLEHEGQGNVKTMILNSYTKKTLDDLKYVEIGKNAKYYKPNDKWKNFVKAEVQLDVDLYVWRGYKTSTYLCPDSQYLQIDFASRVLRDETAHSFMKFFGDRAEEKLVGRSVIADYGNSSVYRVDAIDYNKSPGSTFQMKDGTKITFADYFYKQYNKKIKDMKQPLLLHIDKRRERDVYLIPELVTLSGLEDEEKANFKLMSAISQFTKLTPGERMREIENLAGELEGNKQKVFEFSSGAVPSCKGFLLDAPKIKLGNEYVQPKDGNFQLRQQILEPNRFKDWVFVYCSEGKRDDKEADEIIADFQKASQAYGIKVEDPAFLVVQKKQGQKKVVAQDYINVIEKDIRANGNPQIVVTLVDRSQKKEYAKLKDYLYTQVGVPHQNMVKQSLNKNRMSVLSNILNQMNAKVNKALWKVQPPKDLPNNVMLVGIDVYYKRIVDKKGCFGFVASMNQDMNKYFSRVIIVPEKQQMVTQMSVLMVNAVKQYFKENGRAPETIIVYREGVGDSQVENVLDKEVSKVVEGLSEFSEDYKPALAYILVNKKTSTKFFSGDVQGRGGKVVEYNNPTSGTIVSSQITSNGFDFFLAAQNVNRKQGCCTPTHYKVIHDSTGLPQDFFHQLTYFQCFNYYNWSGAVRVPACVMYAKKLSYLVGDTFQDDVHEKLDTKLFYL